MDVPADTVARAHDVQHDVNEFHRALDIPIGSSPAIRRPELRAVLIEEEARETVDAILAGDLVAAIDGLCDLLCVIYGAAVEFGVNLAPFWDEVHRSNMAKRGGPMRADGKRLKPEGWTPPDIAGVLAAALAAVPVEGCVPPIGTPVPGGDQGSEPPLLAHPVGGTEPVNNNDAGRTTLDGRSAAGVEEKGA